MDELGIDFYRGGRKTVREASETAGLPIERVLESLEQALLHKSVFRDWTAASMSELIHHIQDKHHTFIRKEAPRIDGLLVKAISTHGTRHPELPAIKLEFWKLLRGIVAHMLHEEKVLFPQLIQLEMEPGSIRQAVTSRIERMITEHDQAGDHLAEIRRLSSNFTAPADACLNYRALCLALAAWDKDLLQHLHMENNILFRKAAGLQTRVDRMRWRSDYGSASGSSSSSSSSTHLG